MYGPNKLILTFKEDKVSFEIFKIFAKLLTVILRKNYMKEVLVAGQMKDKKQYIDYKNKFMLYFEDLQWLKIKFIYCKLCYQWTYQSLKFESTTKYSINPFLIY